MKPHDAINAFRGNPVLETDRHATLSPPEQFSWYALRVKSKLGSLVSKTLRGKGYKEFYPLCRSQHRWSDRIKQLEFPLFPGYLFCQFDVNDRLPILTSPGVIGIVGAGKIPIPIDDGEIGAIHRIVRSGLAAQPFLSMVVGSEVYIERGPLAGMTGVITNIEKVCRLVVCVSLLQRSVAVEIDRNWVRVSPQHGSRPHASAL